MKRKLTILFGWICFLSSPVSRADDAYKVIAAKEIYSAEFGGSGETVISHGSGGLFVWNAVTGQKIAVLTGSKARCSGFQMSDDFLHLAASFDGGLMRVFDATTGAALSPEFCSPAASIGKPVFSPDGMQLILRDTEKREVQVVDVATGKIRAHLSVLTKQSPDDESADSQFAHFTPDGAFCYLLGDAVTYRCFETTSWTEKRKPLQHPSNGYAIGFGVSLDGKWAYTSDSPGENGPTGHLQIWDAEKGDTIGGLLSSQNGFQAQFLTDHRILVMPERGAARIYDLPSLKQTYTFRQHDDVYGTRVFRVKNKSWFLCWGCDGSLDCTDGIQTKPMGIFSAGGARLESILAEADANSCIGVFENSNFLTLGHYDRYLIRLSLPDLKTERGASLRVPHWFENVRLSPNGKLLLLIEKQGKESQLRLLDAKTFKEAF